MNILKYLPSTMSVEYKETIQNTTHKMLEHVNTRGRRYKNINIIALSIITTYI